MGTDVAVNIIVSHLDNAEHAEQWLLCDDAERAVTLERVRGIFLSLIKSNKTFAARLVHLAIQYTIHQFEGIISPSQIRCHGLESPKIICFLGASKLEELHEFLKLLARTFGASEHSDVDGFVDVELSSSALGIKERITFSDDFSCLLLDEQQLNITNQSSSIDVYKYDVPMIGKCLELWTSVRKSQRGKAEQLIGEICEECAYFSTSNYRITELSSKMEAIQTLDNICLQETKNRDQCPEHVEQHYMNHYGTLLSTW
ncbi:uncharacterized protein LOC116112794 [Pistacia vera]|uniref:uncharacterized protein LOC116112794 n=1 Tax=Pistacia vera TaxID=55513 RepID=UPI001263CA70|nr:uncharacterized protein LOC116112794 [Pistacia vera]